MVTDPGRGPTEVLFAKLAWRQGDPKIPGDKVHCFTIRQGAVVQSIGYSEPCMCTSISLQLKPLEFPGCVTAPGGVPWVRVEEQKQAMPKLLEPGVFEFTSEEIQERAVEAVTPVVFGERSPKVCTSNARRGHGCKRCGQSLGRPLNQENDRPGSSRPGLHEASQGRSSAFTQSRSRVEP